MYLGSQFWFILWIYSVIVFLISLTKAKLHVLGHCFPVLIKVFHLYQTYLYLKTNNELRNMNNIVCVLRDDRYSDLYYSLFSVQEPICYMMHNKLNDYQYSGMLSVLYHTIKSHFSCVLLYPLHMKDFDQIYKPQKDFVVHYLLLFRLNCVL